MLLVPGYFKNNIFVPNNDISIPDGTQAVVSVDDKRVDEAKEAKKQLKAFKEFFAAIRTIPEELAPEFDEMIARGLKFEEIDLS
jgi:hypothetical protein